MDTNFGKQAHLFGNVVVWVGSILCVGWSAASDANHVVLAAEVLVAAAHGLLLIVEAGSVFTNS